MGENINKYTYIYNIYVYVVVVTSLFDFLLSFLPTNNAARFQVAVDLHKVGVVLHFHKEPGLTDIVYLQPHQVRSKHSFRLIREHSGAAYLCAYPAVQRGCSVEIAVERDHKSARATSGLKDISFTLCRVIVVLGDMRGTL